MQKRMLPPLYLAVTAGAEVLTKTRPVVRVKRPLVRKIEVGKAAVMNRGSSLKGKLLPRAEEAPRQAKLLAWTEEAPLCGKSECCCAARSGSISSKDVMSLLGPAVSVEKPDDCCATRSSLISSKNGMSLLGPAVRVNMEREVCELPVERTAKTGYEVNQSCGKGGALVPLTCLLYTSPSPRD